MFRHTFCLAVLMGLCFAFFTPAAWADDASQYEYCVLYGGNMSDADAHRFSTNLYYHGTNGTWWGQTQWSLASDERDVNHWDLTTGYPPVDPYRYGNMSDLIYYSGHGYPNGVQFWNPVTGSRELDKGKPPGTPPFMPDNLGTKELLFIGGEAARWEIGMDWAGTNRTNSRWDDDPEWVFMASCSQLDSTNYSRRNYARTMLGDPRRLHAIWSYRAGAPDDDVDVNVVDDYFYYAGWGRSNRYAWLNANDKNRNYNAAGLVHRSAEYEGLPPVAPLDPDSPVGSTPDIVYHYMWGNSSQPVAVNNSPAKAVLAWLAKLIRGEEAHAASKPIVFVGRDTVYRLETALPEIRDVPPVITHPTVQDWLAEDAMSVLGPRSTEVEPPLPDAKYRTRLGERGVVRVWDSGAMEFLSATEARQPVTLEESDVVKIAEEYVEQHGGMPADVGRTEVRAYASASIDVDTGDLGPETIQEYVVTFTREVGGLEVSGICPDSITVVVGADGVECYRRQWRQTLGFDRDNPSAVRITPQQALEVLVAQGDYCRNQPSELAITAIDLVYYSKAPELLQEAMLPAWRIRFRDADDFFVNALTGRPMHE